MCTTRCILLSIILFGLVAASGVAQIYSDNALIRTKIMASPEMWEINKSVTNSYFNVDLFSYPKSGVFVFDWDRLGDSLRSSLLLAVDPDWNRLAYTDMGKGFLRAHGSFGTGTDQFRWPQSVDAHAISDGWVSEDFYDIYVADTYNDRICRATYHHQPGPVYTRILGGQSISGSGLWCPIDVSIYDGGTYRPNTDDEVWVLNGNNNMLNFTYDGVFIDSVGLPEECVATALVHGYWGFMGPNIFVADTANDKILKYDYSPSQDTYVKDGTEGIATSSVVDLVLDPYFYLWALDSSGVITKYNYDLSILCRYYVENQLQSPSGFSIAGGAMMSPDMFISEEWTSSSGIQHFVIGTDVVDEEVISNPESTIHTIQYLLLDASFIDVELFEYNDFNAKVRTLYAASGSIMLAGLRSHAWDGTDDSGEPLPTGDYTYRITATSTYGEAQSGVPVNVVVKTGTIYHVGVCADPEITDPDLDGVCGEDDNCFTVYNPAQYDTDGDGLGDECDCGNPGEWATTPGLGADIPTATAVAQMYDGGYLCAGRTASGASNLSQIWRLTPCGDLDWAREFEAPTKRAGGQQATPNDPEKGYYYTCPKLESTDDGGFIFYAELVDGTALVKLDRDGTQVWVSSLSGSGYPRAVRQNPEAGYIALQGSHCLIRADIVGSEMWRTYLPNDNEDGLYWGDVTPTSDGGFVVVRDYWDDGSSGWGWSIIKLTSAGVITSETTVMVPGVGGFDTFPAAVRETDDGGIVVAGSSTYGFILVKYSSLDPLVEEFVRPYSVPSNTGLFDMRMTSDGGFILAGTRGLYSQSHDFAVVKTDAMGHSEWVESFDTGGEDRAMGITESDFGGYVVAGGNALGEGLAHLVKFVEPEGSCCLLRGDINHNGSGPDIADMVYLVSCMFQGGPEPLCMAEADVNGDAGEYPDVGDMIYLVCYMFQEGPPPAPCP